MMVIVMFILIFFGSKNMPEMARGLGKGMRQFKDAMNGVQYEIEKEMNEIKKQENLKDVESLLKEETRQISQSLQDEPGESHRQGEPPASPAVDPHKEESQKPGE